MTALSGLQDGPKTAKIASKPIVNRILLATSLQMPPERSLRGPRTPSDLPPGPPRRAPKGSKRAPRGINLGTFKPFLLTQTFNN